MFAILPEDTSGGGIQSGFGGGIVQSAMRSAVQSAMPPAPNPTPAPTPAPIVAPPPPAAAPAPIPVVAAPAPVAAPVASPAPIISPTPAPAPAGSPSLTAAPTSGSSGYTPWTVTAPQTVEDRINHIINGGSPIIDSARARANDAMNARGLTNSSLGVTAGETAAYDAAMPIATADAATFAKSENYNADIQNQMSMQGRQLGAQKDIAELQADTSLATTKLNNQTALAQTQLSTDAQKAISSMSNATQVQINADLNANRVLLQNSQAAVNLANQYALNVGNIEANNQMDEAAKQRAIQTQKDIFNQSMGGLTRASPGIPDVSSTLVFGQPAPAPAPAAIAQQVLSDSALAGG